MSEFEFSLKNEIQWLSSESLDAILELDRFHVFQDKKEQCYPQSIIETTTEKQKISKDLSLYKVQCSTCRKCIAYRY